MVEVFILMICMGAMCGFFFIADVIATIVAFIVYRLDNGKHGFKKFVKRWKALK